MWQHLMASINATRMAHGNPTQFAGTRTEGAWVRMGGQDTWATVANGTGWNPKSTVRKLLYQKDLCGGKLFAGTDNGLWVLDTN